MALPARDRPPAWIAANRLKGAGGPDLEIQNRGRGNAQDLEILRIFADGGETQREPLAQVPVLGAGVTYLVTLADAAALPLGGPVLQVVWRNHDGSEGMSCWRRSGDGLSFVEIACP